MLSTRLSSLSRLMPRRVLIHSLSSTPSLDESLIVTKSCAQQIKRLQDKAKNPNLHLRLQVDGGGCSGFQYVFKIEDQPTDTTTITEDDKIFERENSKVVIDSGSFELVKGATIDYVQEMIRSSFAVVNNPQSESACGCGSSFAVKNFSANPALD